MATYDLATLHAQVRDILPKGTRFSIELQVWDHAQGGLDVEVRIWDTALFESFCGPTPEIALQLLKAHYDRHPKPADLGLVVVPEESTGRTVSARNVRVTEYGGSPMDNEG